MTGVAGITADANSLINYARNAAQRYLRDYDDDMPVEQLAQRLCDLKQGYTQYGGGYTGREAIAERADECAFELTMAALVRSSSLWSITLVCWVRPASLVSAVPF